MKNGGGSESTVIIGPSKSVLVYALHSLEYVLGLARFQVFVPKLLLYYKKSLILLADGSSNSSGMLVSYLKNRSVMIWQSCTK